LALRQGPALAAAVGALPLPDVVFVDATGRDHPRRAGLALHLGAVLELPTVGVTHRPLVADGPFPARDQGSVSPLTIDGEEVGAWLRTVRDARPVAVHAGWQTDVATAVAIVQASSAGARTPEPIRQARGLARSTRAADA
jgi:deoxyribonuclease V